MRSHFMLAGVAAALLAAPASATIVIFDAPGSVQTDENVLFRDATTSGNNLTTNTNRGTSVTFFGQEPLTAPSRGQARLEAVDGGFSTLDFALTDETLGFRTVVFNINGTAGDVVSLRFLDQFGEAFTGDYTLTTGQNFFSARAIDDQIISRFSFTVNGDVQDVRQVRIGGVGALDGGGGGNPNPVPEPATWAMLIAGFGLVGATARRRRSLPRLSA